MQAWVELMVKQFRRKHERAEEWIDDDDMDFAVTLHATYNQYKSGEPGSR